MDLLTDPTSLRFWLMIALAGILIWGLRSWYRVHSRQRRLHDQIVQVVQFLGPDPVPIERVMDEYYRVHGNMNPNELHWQIATMVHRGRLNCGSRMVGTEGHYSTQFIISGER